MMIDFDGIDGSGKTTLLQITKAKLQDKGFKVFSIKPLSKEKAFLKALSKYRHSLGNDEQAPYVKTFSADLVAFNLYQFSLSLSKFMRQYDFILLDRYVLCQLVYNSVWQTKSAINSQLLGLCRPTDLTLITECDPKVAEQRIKHRGNLKPTEFSYVLRRLDQSYHEQEKNFNGRTARLNTSGELDITKKWAFVQGELERFI